MARYIVESKRRRTERDTREKHNQLDDRQMRQQRQKLVDLRREYILEKYGNLARASKRPSEQAELEARRTELIEIHRRSIQEEVEDDDDDDDDDDGQNGRFYVIEKLLDKRVNAKGVEEYKVRWKNYPPSEDSWEPRSELERNAQDMIDEFENIGSRTESNAKHCICKIAYAAGKGPMIECFTCKNWFHFSCLNINLYEANCYVKYHCEQCRDQDPELRCVIKPRKLYKLQGLDRMGAHSSAGAAAAGAAAAASQSLRK